jgi:predicted extracellular nuclease
VRAKRAAQAESLARLVHDRQASGESVIVLGDMNAPAFSDGYVDVVGTVRGAPAPRDAVVTSTRDLVDPDLQVPADALDPAERYSYVFDGVAEQLDHVLVSADLSDRVTALEYARGNADAPEVWRSDAARPERLSDHDGARILLRLR